MLRQTAKLTGFVAAIGLLGFLPFILLSRSSFLQPQPSLAQPGSITPVQQAKLERQLHETTQLNLRVNLTRRQVGLYRGDRALKTYPIAIGQQGWETPTGTFKVMQMIQEPSWIHPFTNEMIPSGDPRNPLGHYWIGFWSDGHNSIGFHGTSDPDSVGAPTSHGCLRMYNSDIQELYSLVQPDMPVSVVR